MFYYSVKRVRSLQTPPASVSVPNAVFIISEYLLFWFLTSLFMFALQYFEERIWKSAASSAHMWSRRSIQPRQQPGRGARQCCPRATLGRANQPPLGHFFSHSDFFILMHFCSLNMELHLSLFLLAISSGRGEVVRSSSLPAPFFLWPPRERSPLGSSTNKRDKWEEEP